MPHCPGEAILRAFVACSKVNQIPPALGSCSYLSFFLTEPNDDLPGIKSLGKMPVGIDRMLHPTELGFFQCRSHRHAVTAQMMQYLLPELAIPFQTTALSSKAVVFFFRLMHN